MRWREEAPPTISPTLIVDSEAFRALNPARVVSDATGAADVGSLTFSSVPDRLSLPILTRQAGDQLRSLAVATNAFYIFGLVAAAAAVFELRGVVSGSKSAHLAYNEAAGAALLEGAAENRLAFTLVNTLWSVAA